MDKFPTINILLIELRELIRCCNECFQIRRNRTLDRHVFLSRKRKPSESLNQFWNALNGLAAKCDFGDQKESLVHDISVFNMANKQVQEKLCTEPKETPTEALQFASAFEDGLKRQKSYNYINQEPRVKDEPVCAVSTSNSRECWRCGAANSTPDHLKRCKAPEAMCNYCGRKGHLERVCNRTRRERPKSAPYLRLKNIQGTTIGKIWKKIFFSKKLFLKFFSKKVFFKSHNAEKLKKRPFRLIQRFLQTENLKKCKGVPFDKFRKFSKKSRIVPKKNPKGGPFGLTCTFGSIKKFMV